MDTAEMHTITAHEFRVKRDERDKPVAYADLTCECGWHWTGDVTAMHAKLVDHWLEMDIVRLKRR